MKSDPLHGAPKIKRFFDWTQYRWRTVVLIDIGAKRPNPKAPAAADHERISGLMNQIIYAWLEQNGPATIKQISEGSGVHFATVYRSLKGNSEVFDCLEVGEKFKTPSVWKVRDNDGE